MNRVKNKLGKISIECKINQPIKHDLETMKVTSLELTDVGGIQHLKLDSINEQMNIICGENGVGKTNILDSIAFLSSKWNENQIKKRVGSDSGEIKAAGYTSDGEHFYISGTIDDFEPSISNRYRTGIASEIFHKQVIYLRTTRDIVYQQQRSIESDPEQKEYAQDVISGVSSSDLKTWFIGRFYQRAAGNLEDQFIHNYDLAIGLFSELNKEFSFKNVTRKNEIMVTTPTGDVYLEYLSSGFKSSLFILLGIIKDIEYRFQDLLLKADEFDGIIIIDEIELHLHPEWQGTICTTLKRVFSKAQFFITTHSPHVVQTASKNEVFALKREGNRVVKLDSPTSEYGYQGWTVEEILENVMGMPDLRTKKYKGYEASFIKALEDNDKVAAQAAYDELDKMLHSSYPLRPVFRMQLDSLGE